MVMNRSGYHIDNPSYPLLELLRSRGLFYSGTVTAVPGANQFTIPTLAGLGAGKFQGAMSPYAAFVFRDAGGLSALPQGEMQLITAYANATGTFTTMAFTAPVAVGDEILILNPVFWSMALTGQILHEQDSIPIDVDAVAGGETDILNEPILANRHYTIRHMRVKCADPGANTVTVRLYELINAVLTLVDTFDITTANFTNYFSLMDMFGLAQLGGDHLQVTVQASAGGPYAVTGQYTLSQT